MVRIIDGPFANFSGNVDDVNSEGNTLRVLVTIFGRATPVEFEFLQWKKNQQLGMFEVSNGKDGNRAGQIADSGREGHPGAHRPGC